MLPQSLEIARHLSLLCAANSYNFTVKQLVLDLIPAALPTLENFVATRNSEAVSALRAQMFSPKNLPSSNAGAGFRAVSATVIYLWGPSGAGKTHLARALASSPGGVDAVPLCQTTRLADARLIAPHTCYVLDDVHTFADAAQVALFNLINLANQADAPARVIATGPTAPRDLALRPELTSRLGSGLVFQLQPLDDTDKADALRAHAQSRGFALREDVANHLLRHSRRDMASLIAMLDALDQYSLETGREITLPLLRELAQPTLTNT